MARMAPMAAVSLKEKTAVKFRVRVRRSRTGAVAKVGGPGVLFQIDGELGADGNSDLLARWIEWRCQRDSESREKRWPFMNAMRR